MKIIHILNHFLPHQTAGTEVYTWALSKQLQQHGVEVKVVIPYYGKTDSADYVYDGLTVYQFAEPSLVDRALIMGFRVPEGLINFVAYLNEEQPDLVHFHELAGSNGITIHHVQAARNSGAKVIMTFHLAGYTCKTGSLVYKGEALCDGVIDLQKCSTCYLHTRGYSLAAPYLIGASSILHQLSVDASKWDCKIGTALGTVSIISKLKEDLKFLVSQCHYVVSLTDWYEKILLANGIDQSKIKVIEQGIPLDPTNYTSKRKIHEGPLKLIFLGRINKFKGLHILIDAIKDINPLSVQLSVFGNSDDEIYENSLKIGTASNDNISWKGKLNQEDVVKTLKQYDALCLCSTFSEMSPIVIQEAFAAGIPVLASNVYGNAEQIQHNYNGLLFDYNNVDDLKLQLLRCINEEDLLENLTKNIANPKSFRDVGSEYLDLYKSLLN